ncbi:Hypothetical predicted protein [Pelobates cultripes]|uniref:Uncharacterized protein n=1 Tax=Pelobates cultripes TaxID=61616 RepID=A0AAD1WQ97_PELCU|nr:Hypothetical predicted protein [Pelobates cultripes]
MAEAACFTDQHGDFLHQLDKIFYAFWAKLKLRQEHTAPSRLPVVKSLLTTDSPYCTLTQVMRRSGQGTTWRLAVRDPLQRCNTTYQCPKASLKSTHPEKIRLIPTSLPDYLIDSPPRGLLGLAPAPPDRTLFGPSGALAES